MSVVNIFINYSHHIWHLHPRINKAAKHYDLKIVFIDLKRKKKIKDEKHGFFMY